MNIYIYIYLFINYYIFSVEAFTCLCSSKFTRVLESQIINRKRQTSQQNTHVKINSNIRKYDKFKLSARSGSSEDSQIQSISKVRATFIVIKIPSCMKHSFRKALILLYFPNI